MRYLSLLFILLATGLQATSEVLYPDLLDDQVWVKIDGYGDEHVLPTPYRTTSTNGVDLNVWYAEAFWAEPTYTQPYTTYTNTFIYTNGYDMVLEVDQVVRNKAIQPGYTIITDHEVYSVTQTVDSVYVPVTNGVYDWQRKVIAPEDHTRWNSDSYNYRAGTDGWKNPIYSESRMFHQRMFKSYDETNLFPMSEFLTLNTSFGDISFSNSFEVSYQVDYNFNQIGYATDSFRWDMSGCYLTNWSRAYDNVHIYDQATYFSEYGSNIINAVWKEDRNALHPLVRDPLNLNDQIVFSVYPTNTGDYATTGTTYLDNGSLVMEDGATVTFTVPGSTFTDGMIYHIDFRDAYCTDSYGGYTYKTRGDFIDPSGSDMNVTFTAEVTESISRFYEFEVVEFDPRRMVYTEQDFATGLTFTRNTNCWAYGLDLTPFSPWHTTNVQGWPEKTCGAGTVIARDIVLFANHFKVAVGEVMHFVTLDNEVITRTLIDTESLESDIAIGRLDSPLPSSIAHCYVYPADFERYMPFVYGITAIRMNQMELAMASSHVINLQGLDSQTIAWSQGHINETVADLNYNQAWDGDSGNSVCHYVFPNGSTNLADAMPVALWCHYYPKWGGNASRFFDEINEAISDMGSVYQLTPFPFEQLGYEPITE